MHTHVPTPQGVALVEELKWVHGMIRRDLATVRRLASEVLNGLSPAEVRAGVQTLQTNGPLWTLRINCLSYCRMVHLHHSLESAHLFPALRDSNPSLGPVIDKLEADHLRVSGQLDEVEAACRELAGTDTSQSRQRLADALQTLATDLLAHLDFEEEQVSATMSTWTRWPL